MKVDVLQQVPPQYSQSVLQAIFRVLQTQTNLHAEGRLAGRYFNATTVPTTGSFAKGDLIWEANPTVMGSVAAGVAADYVRVGWICTSDGTPGTLKELRIPVGSGSGVSVNNPTLGTPVASTSGTSVDFTGIPSWATEISIQFVGVSTNGTDNLLIQIGDSGGIETTGYSSVSSGMDSTVATSTYTSGFGIRCGSAANVLHGRVVLTLENSSSFTWAASGVVSTTLGASFITAGSKSTSAALDRVRITTTGGTNTFDAGEINILYK